MAVSKTAIDVPEQCRKLGLVDVPHPFGYGFMVRTQADLDSALMRFRERVGKDPVTFNWKSGSLILSEVNAKTGQEFSDARARSRAAASATGQVQFTPVGDGAGHTESGPVTEGDGGSPDYASPVDEASGAIDTPELPGAPQPLSELPGLDARCDICGGDLLNCWCEP